MRGPEHYEKQWRSIDRLERMANMLDSRYTIPGTTVRFGADAIIGLVPGVGDLATTALAAYIFWQARKMGISRWAQTRMMTYLLLDTTIGAIPLAGDAFDVWFKANKRNVNILKKELARRSGYPGEKETV